MGVAQVVGNNGIRKGRFSVYIEVEIIIVSGNGDV
jgi:hypothetical protein